MTRGKGNGGEEMLGPGRLKHTQPCHFGYLLTERGSIYYHDSLGQYTTSSSQLSEDRDVSWRTIDTWVHTFSPSQSRQKRQVPIIAGSWTSHCSNPLISCNTSAVLIISTIDWSENRPLKMTCTNNRPYCSNIAMTSSTSCSSSCKGRVRTFETKCASA